MLAQHVRVACAGPFMADDLYAEVTCAAPYADVSRAQFDQVLAFVTNGGYALQAYPNITGWRRSRTAALFFARRGWHVSTG